MNIPKKLPLWISGKEVFSEKTFETINPFDQSVISLVSIASEEQINQAVADAKKASESWRKVAPKERARVLLETARILRSQNDELAKIETTDTGKAIRETICVDIVSAIDCLEYMASLISVHSSRHIPLGHAGFAYTLSKPLGVCAGIGAWNYPIQIAAWKSAPALATGNAFIFKPSEQTPISAFFLAKAYKEAGLPDGLFQVVQGAGDVGKLLVEHTGIAKVSLTGSVETGKKIYSSCANSLKKLSLELGGKSPLIIFDDANLEDAVQATLLANFYSSGQVCSNGTRVFVHSKIKEKFEGMLLSETKKIICGDPMDEKVHLGPLVSAKHKENVSGHIKLAKEHGATFLLDDTDMGGNFITPIILTNGTDKMSCARDEIFGPVVTLLNFDNEAEVVDRANDTNFGLAGGVFTNDLERAHRVAQNLEVGTTWINAYNLAPVEVPFGGAKHSGLGSENGHEVLKEYTRTQSVFVKGEENPNIFF